MATEFSTGIALGKRLVEALGLPPGSWQRIVIEVDVRGTPRVWVKSLIPAKHADGIVRAVEELKVSEHGEVTAVAATDFEAVMAEAVPSREKLNVPTTESGWRSADLHVTDLYVSNPPETDPPHVVGD